MPGISDAKQIGTVPTALTSRLVLCPTAGAGLLCSHADGLGLGLRTQVESPVQVT